MKSQELKNKGQSLAPYASPSVAVIETSVQRVLCGSGGADTPGLSPDETPYNF